ncbi:DUF4232 domain-containing protein [Streptomyces cinnamoneus]|uniref:DUF4232 domain-containing protein n=1 Tax=Streptomyces cinnamoneus TaxID=53446 RepID=A0A918WDY2_STRCJ|nr:DUF4232 domain-containing protein [Streptomyces cinnamoneus]GHC34980.1 hypothetical protein GCM10010507_04910 [Streptomyces cinnamoneus]
MIRHKSRTSATAAAAALVLATAVVPAHAATSAADRAGAAVATCGTSDLRIGFAERLGGGMNHAGGTLELKNTSGRACALRGYPGLGLEDARHTPLPTRTVRGSTWYADDPGNRLVVLGPGRTARAVVSWTHTGTQAHKAASLQVTPPAATTHRTIALDDVVDFGELHVTAVAHQVPVRG